MGPLGVRRLRLSVMCAVTTVALAGCAIPRPEGSAVIAAPQHLTEPVCIAPPSGSMLVGAWYILRKQTGVVGEIQTLLTLSPDGKMTHQTRVKQGRNIRSELREAGCWDAPAGKLVLRTHRSNGELVDYRDPIYVSTYLIDRNDAKRAVFREDKADSRPMTAQKVHASFRLQ
jgi:hypothetical protein